MPEYLAPGVFVEETSFRSKSIEGVSTSTTAFVGPTRSGPVGAIPELLTSFADFERIYGGLDNLDYAGANDPKTNYLAHAVMAYFNEGGARLYVTRVAGASVASEGADLVTSPARLSKFVARFPGAFGGTTINPAVITIELKASASSTAAATKAIDGSFLRINANTPVLLAKQGGVWRGSGGGAHTFTAANETAGMDLLTLKVTTLDGDGHLTEYDDLGLDPLHKRYIGVILAKTPSTAAAQLSQAFAFDVAATVTAFQLHTAFQPDAGSAVKTISLTNGTDVVPTLQNYLDALEIVEGLEGVSIVASPGHTEFPTLVTSGSNGVTLALLSHAEQRRAYRIAVLDVPKGQLLSGAQAFKGKIDSKYAALYYPWVVAPNPDFNPADPYLPAELLLPPSGFVCGIYARSDTERGVHKAPANEIVRSAVRFERLVTTGEQEVLNPLGINCLRFFSGRGNRVWGARTTSSDPEWKYVNVRRYFLYLEQSIDRGTQWAVFEPNGERLWANVRDTITSFLHNEWVNGALLGDKPEQAFFVKCDRTTMTQNDLDNGRLICLVGVAAIKPAEFVVFRIGQKTADSRA
ncbi:MAG: phage tail sheath family protein [Burkholderiales bacterium]|nr:phage tail sheath family protein [Opitutaceae bacterium]